MDDYVTLNKMYFGVMGITTDYKDAKELELGSLSAIQLARQHGVGRGP